MAPLLTCVLGGRWPVWPAKPSAVSAACVHQMCASSVLTGQLLPPAEPGMHGVASEDGGRQTLPPSSEEGLQGQDTSDAMAQALRMALFKLDHKILQEEASAGKGVGSWGGTTALCVLRVAEVRPGDARLPGGPLLRCEGPQAGGRLRHCGREDMQITRPAA